MYFQKFDARILSMLFRLETSKKQFLLENCDLYVVQLQYLCELNKTNITED